MAAKASAPQAPTIPLPPAKPPMCARLATLFPVPGKPGEHVVFNVHERHPMFPGSAVGRIYLIPGVGAEVYSAGTGEGGEIIGCRTLVPWPQILWSLEIMDVETFVAEVTEAENDGDDPDPGPGEAPAAVSPAAAANGGAS